MISIIIPTLNEGKHIGTCLSILSKQLKAEDEIIIIDSYSKDDTEKIAKQYRVKVITQPKKGIGLAKTFGARAAKNDIIVFLDADSVVSNDFVERIKNHFKNEQVVAVGGLGIYNSDSHIRKMVYDTYSKGIFYCAKAVHKVSGKYWLASNNCAFRKTLFFSVGGYKSVICEDTELSMRLPPTKHIVYDSKLKLELSDRRFKEHGFLNTLRLWAWSDVALLFGEGLKTDGYRKD